MPDTIFAEGWNVYGLPEHGVDRYQIVIFDNCVPSVRDYE